MNALDRLCNETVRWHFLPLRRAHLKALMDRAGYDRTGFGSGDYWAFARPSIDAEPLPYEIAKAAFEALENDDPDAAMAIALSTPGRANRKEAA